MAKRGQGEGTISKRPDGTWWARITVGKDANGKQKRKAFYGNLRAEVQKKMTAALNEVNNGNYIEPSKMTVAQWLDIWLKEYKKFSLKPTTYGNYSMKFERFIKPRIGDCKLKDLRTDTLQKLINELRVTGVSSASIRGTYHVIYSALRQAVDSDLILKNPATKIILPKLEKKKMNILSQEEQNRFIEVAQTVYMGEVFMLDLGTGLRLGDG